MRTRGEGVQNPENFADVINGRLLRSFGGVMIPVLDPDPESDFQLFGDSGYRFGSSEKRNLNTYRGVR